MRVRAYIHVSPAVERGKHRGVTRSTRRVRICIYDAGYRVLVSAAHLRYLERCFPLAFWTSNLLSSVGLAGAQLNGCRCWLYTRAGLGDDNYLLLETTM